MSHYSRWPSIILPALLAGAMGMAGCMNVAACLAHVALKGEVVDQDGQRLDGVKLRITKHPYPTTLRDMPREAMPADELMMVNGDFDVSYWHMSLLYLDFTKDGYYPERVILSEDNSTNKWEFARLTRNGALTPSAAKDQVHLVLQKMGKTTTLERWSGLKVKDAWQAQVLDFAKRPPKTPEEGEFVKITDSKDVPANGLAALMDRDLKTGDLRKQALPESDLWVYPVGVRLYYNAPGSGFLVYRSTRPEVAFRDMKDAPETGYQAELAVTNADLKTFATMTYAGSPRKDNYVYFYFKTADGKYGKGAMGWTEINRKAVGWIGVVLYIQPDGTRNLEDPNAKIN